MKIQYLYTCFLVPVPHLAYEGRRNGSNRAAGHRAARSAPLLVRGRHQTLLFGRKETSAT